MLQSDADWSISLCWWIQSMSWEIPPTICQEHNCSPWTNEDASVGVASHSSLRSVKATEKLRFHNRPSVHNSESRGHVCLPNKATLSPNARPKRQVLEWLRMIESYFPESNHTWMSKQPSELSKTLIDPCQTVSCMLWMKSNPDRDMLLHPIQITLRGVSKEIAVYGPGSFQWDSLILIYWCLLKYTIQSSMRWEKHLAQSAVQMEMWIKCSGLILCWTAGWTSCNSASSGAWKVFLQ